MSAKVGDLEITEEMRSLPPEEIKALTMTNSILSKLRKRLEATKIKDTDISSLIEKLPATINTC